MSLEESQGQEAVPLLGTDNESQRRKQSTVHVCLVLFVHVVAISLAFIPAQQWLLLYLCRRYDPTQYHSDVYQSVYSLLRGTPPLTTLGLSNDPNTQWEQCRSNPSVQVIWYPN
jgi:hypothetical protein